MKKSEAKERIEKLKKEINHHRYLYHVLDREEISAAALDSLKYELATLEEAYPDLITPDSPTQRVGGKPLAKFAKITHGKRMNSLNDAFSKEDVADWVRRNEKILEKTISGFYCDLKMDGLAVELVYRNGILETAATRGDGLIGEDVTQNVKTIDAIPLSLRPGFPEELVLRGEVFLTKKEFSRINAEQAKKEGRLYANPRNVAAGAVRQLDPSITASRKLDFYAYGIVGEGERFFRENPTHEAEYKNLNRYGIKTNPHGLAVSSLSEIILFHQKMEEKREKLPYEIDGIVISINDNRDYERLGIVGKTPRGAIAYKFAAAEATTILRDIMVQVGRRGTLTPVAVLAPVPIGGVTVSRATLHNEDEIKRLGVKIGDTVIVERAGDVIPRVKDMLPRLRPKNAKSFSMPKFCPVCGKPVVRKEGEVAYRCVNPDCPAVNREGTYHFVSRKGFEIVGLGPKIIDVLMDEGLIQDAADLFMLKEGDIAILERFGEKSAGNLIRSIAGRKNIPLSRFIYSLGIPHVGEETAFDLANHFGSIDKLGKVSKEELESVRDVGGVVSESIYQWFRNPRNKRFIEKLKVVGVRAEPIAAKKRSKALMGKVFVLTGGLKTLTRDQAKDKIREAGGEVSGSVSKKTDYVVFGDDPGSKFDRAKALGVKTITENEFLKLVE